MEGAREDSIEKLVVKREKKHVQIYERINSLSGTIQRLERLVDRIDGKPAVDENDAKEERASSPPPLAIFLEVEVDRLQKMNSHLINQIERLESLLF